MASEADLLKRLRAIECEESYLEFFKDAWSVIEPATPLILNWHITYLCEILDGLGKKLKGRERQPKDLIINIPPTSSKSSICTKIWPVWLWVIDPSLRIITGSYGSTLATTLAIKSRDIITSEIGRASCRERV